MNRNFLIQAGLTALAVVLIAAATGGVAWAQEAAADPASGGKEFTLWDTIKAGGEVGACILILSVVSIGMMIDFAVNIRRDKVIPPDVLQDIEAALDEDDVDGARSLCEGERTPLSNILLAAFSKADQGYEVLREAAEEQAGEESLKLLQKISWLNLISAVAPMMGLLGTVTGMISAFNTIATSGGTATAADLASGISQALVTTVEGLIVALPGIFGYFYFKNKVARLVTELGITVGTVTERFRGQ